MTPRSIHSKSKRKKDDEENFKFIFFYLLWKKNIYVKLKICKSYSKTYKQKKNDDDKKEYFMKSFFYFLYQNKITKNKKIF